MKFFYDLLPVILFFVAYKIYDIFVATAVAIIATLAQIAIVYLKHRKLEKMLVFNGLMISILGGLTILLKDKYFIMWKPSVIYWAFALALLFADQFFNRNLVQLALGKQMELSKIVWKKINIFTALFFIFLGFVNLFVAYNYSENTWVNFKLFGLTGLLFLYMIAIAIYISKTNKD